MYKLIVLGAETDYEVWRGSTLGLRETRGTSFADIDKKHYLFVVQSREVSRKAKEKKREG
jgi:hypothetical protein